MAIKFLNTVQVDTDVLYVDTADDRVGIGTDNPDVRLHVDGGSGILVNSGGGDTVLSANSNTGIFSIGDTGELGDGVYATNTGTSYFDIYSGGGVKFRMDSNGDVGIGTGTSAPTQKLHVNGNARLTGLFYDGTNSGGTAGQILSSDGGQTEWIDQGDIVVGEADKAKSVTLRVKNSTASAMTKGQVICEAVSATPPSGNLIEVALADNNGANKMPALGILNEDLDASGGNNDEGDAIMFGKVSGIDTSDFEVGDEVFVSDTPGGLTTTKPTGVKYIQKVGVVIRDDNTNGTIEVFGAGRVNDVPTPLYVDHANQRLGIGEENPDTLLHLSGNSPTIKLEDNVGGDYYNPKIEFFGTSEGGTLEYISNPAFQGMQLHYRSIGSGQSTYLKLKYGQADFSSDVTGGTTLKTDGVLQVTGSNDSYFSNGDVGIGTTDPDYKLEVNGTLGVNRTDGIIFAGSAVAGLGNKITSDTSNNFIFSTSLPSVPYTTTPKMTILNGGNVGIGTTNPNAKLEVDGSVRVTGNGLDVGYGNNGTNFIQIGNGRTTNGYAFIDLVGDLTNSDYGLRIIRNNTGPNTSTQLIHRGTGALDFNVSQGGSMTFKTNNTERIRINSLGNVGIGTTGPDGRLTIGSGLSTDNSTMFNVDGQYNDVGFNGGTSGLLTQGVWSFINSGTWDQTRFYVQDQNNNDSRLTFDFKGNAGNIDILAGTSSGNVGIGTTGPTAKLDVVQSTAANGAAALHLIGPASNPALTSSVLIVEQGDGKKITIDGNDIDVSSGDLFINDYSREDVTFGGQIKVSGGGSPVGDSYFANGNVGIGITNPRTKLHVSGLTGDDDPALGSSTAPLFISNTANSYGLNVGVNNVGASWLQAQSNTSSTAYEMSLNPLGGNVGVGQINPGYKLDVAGTGRFTSTVTATNFILSSDETLKDNIKEVDTKHIDVDWKNFELKSEPGIKRAGVIAQELEIKHPEFVRTAGDGLKSVAYIDLLITKIAELEARLEKLEK